MKNTRSTVAIDAGADIAHHCDHDPEIHGDGYASWVVGGLFNGDVIVYLDGTPDQLRDFARRVILVANLHEAKTAECSGRRYDVNPDAPDEGTDIAHDGPCPVHADQAVSA